MDEQAVREVMREFTKARKVSGNELILRELLQVHALQYCAILNSEVRPPFDLRATLDRAGLNHAIVLDGNTDIPAESNVIMCGHIDIDVFLLKNNFAMMECSFFLARPLDDNWQVYGAKSTM